MRLIDADALIKKLEGKEEEEYYGWVFNYGDVFDAIDELSTVEQSKWIPCSERLPEDDTPVLVYLFESNSPYIAWVSDCEWFTEEFEVEKEYEPKAWMALPDPFESEGL